MPVNTYKHVVVSADTRTTEFFMAVISGSWAAWILFANHAIAPEFLSVVQRTGSYLVWGTWPAVNCLFQAFAIYYKYPKLRMAAAIMPAIYWICIAYIMLHMQPDLFTPYMAVIFATIQLWILLHRGAAPYAK